MQLSVSTPSSDTNRAALLIGGEAAPSAVPALGTAVPTAAFAQLITDLTPGAPPAAAAATSTTPVAVPLTVATPGDTPVALRLAPALRSFTPVAGRSSQASTAIESELPLPTSGEITSPLATTAKPTPRPALRGPARGPTSKSDSLPVAGGVVNAQQFPATVPVAPTPLPVDLVTLAPATVAEEISPSEPSALPQVEHSANSAAQISAPVGAPATTVSPASAPIPARAGTMLGPAAIAMDRAAVAAPMPRVEPQTVSDVTREQSAPLPQTSTGARAKTAANTSASPEVAVLTPALPALATDGMAASGSVLPIESELTPIRASAADPRPVAVNVEPAVASASAAFPLVGESNTVSSAAVPVVAEHTSLRSFAPADLVSRQFSPSPRSAPSTTSTEPTISDEAMPFTSPLVAEISAKPAPVATLTSAPSFSSSISSVSFSGARDLAPTEPTPAPVATFAPADLVSRQFTPSPRSQAPAAPETIAASFADSRSPERLQTLPAPILARDVAPAPISLPVGTPASSAIVAGSSVPAAPTSFSPVSAPAVAVIAEAPIAVPAVANAAAPSAPAPVSIPAQSAAAVAAATKTTAQPGEIASVGPKAKIAARAENRDSTKKTASGTFDKTFLNDGEQEVTVTSERVGTDVAKSGPVMPTTMFTEQPATAAVPMHASVAPVARDVDIDFAALDAASAPTESEAVAHAQRAVEAVLVAADRSANGERQTVNLHFTVGGNDLAVRVEMRADEVRTTFHTASPELRDALAREWQAVNAEPSADRSYRLAPAVFTSGSGDVAGNFSSLGGDASSRQRDSGAQRAEDQVFSTFAPRSSRPADAAPASPAVASAPSAARPGTHRLLTHA